MGFGHRTELRLGERARDSKHEFVDEILNESDIEQIQYMVGERVSSEIQYIARDSKHEFVDIERRY